MGRNKDILLIDDDEDFRQVMAEVLKEEGYRVSFAGEKKETEKIIKKQKPDIAIIDYQLGKTDGFKLAARVRKLSRPKMVRIIIISAQQNIRDEAKKRYGYFFDKPVNFPSFFKTLKNL